MKFKLFGGLDCPDTLLAQLSVIGNTDIVTTKALGALTDHVMSMLLLNAASSTSALGNNTTNAVSNNGGLSSSTSNNNQQLTSTEIEVRTATLKLFIDVLKPITHPNSSTAGGGGSDKLDGFATKAVAFHESQRLQRAKAAAAAAKKFVVGATAAEIEQMSLQAASQQQQLAIAEDALSQALVALNHIIINMSRFSIGSETLTTELTMLGMAPEAVEAIRAAVKGGIASFKDRTSADEGANEGADEEGNGGKKQKKGSSSSNSSNNTRLDFIFGNDASSTTTNKGGDDDTTAAILRRIALASCPRIGGDSPIGAITPFTRTSTITALQQVVKSEEATEEEAAAPLTADKKALAEAVVTNTNEDASQIATTTAHIRITTHGGKTIELTHAQARTLLNELVIARDIMRGEAEEQ